MQINFVREKRAASLAAIEGDRKIARKVSIGLVIYVVIFLIVLGVSFFVQSRIRDADARIQRAQTQLVGLVPFEKEYGGYVRKIKILFELSEKRKEKIAATNYFYSVVPAELVLKDVKVDDERKTIDFLVEADDVFEATRGLQAMYEQSKDTTKYKLLVTAMTRRSVGVYELSGNLTYGAK